MTLYGQCVGNVYVGAGDICQCGGQQAQPHISSPAFPTWDTVRGDRDITQLKYCVMVVTVMMPVLLF